MYNYNHLYYFYITAKSGGVTLASEHLHISQPSVSSQLKVLENSLQVKLFERDGRNIKLTEHGKVVYGYCQSMFELSDQLRVKLSTNQVESKNDLILGISDILGYTVLSDILSILLKSIPHDRRPKVIISSGTHEELVSKLKFKEINLMISESALVDESSDIHVLETMHLPVVLISSSHKHQEDLLPPWDDKTQWVIPTVSHQLRQATKNYMEQERVQGRVVVEVESFSTATQIVASGIGSAFMPLCLVHHHIRNKSLKWLGNPKGYWDYKLHILGQKQAEDEGIVKDIVQQFRCQTL
ncbi:MAG: LysR family transcriptional regulator [Bacteriovoracaceae bacterium]|jgi:LysR family transcriptional activator of nhaA